MDLNRLGNSKSVALERRDELSLLRISNVHADALIALQGAQVLEFTPKDQRPLIWLSEIAAFKRGQSIRGGIPVCWPWFGDVKRNPDPVQKMTRGENLPAHGLVRAQDWMIEAIDERSNATVVVLRYATMATTQSEWPHDATLILTVSIGKTLHLQLSTRNDSRSELAITQALHAYFPVSDIRAVEIRGFEQTRFIDTLDDWREHEQNVAIEFFGETDRIYLDVPARVELIDRGWQRSIFLDTRNSHSAIVWNPWIEKSQRLSQFPDDAWQRMACIETANAWSDSVTLQPGAEHTLAVEISA
jgi:glucose-6-phosphate 1-epimerase